MSAYPTRRLARNDAVPVDVRLGRSAITEAGIWMEQIRKSDTPQRIQPARRDTRTVLVLGPNVPSDVTYRRDRPTAALLVVVGAGAVPVAAEIHARAKMEK